MTETASTDRATEPIADRAARVAARLKAHLELGVLAFPLSPFSEDGSTIDLPAFRAHLRGQIAAGAGALFVCCGTGEFSALDEAEYGQLIEAAVEEAAGRLPILAGIGYGWAQAVRFAAIAEKAGADAALLLPHYLVRAPQSGLVRHVEIIAENTGLPFILYQRGLVKYTVASLAKLARIPNVIGLKDGHSDHVELQRMQLAADPDFLFFNGALTAEMQARPYASIGIPAYSSAVHGFAPEIASTFFTARRDGDTDTVELLLRKFYSPFVELRDRQSGYAVALIKTAARIRGHQVGPVRAPLMDPVGKDLEDLEAIVRSGLALVGADL
ncbi:MAG: 5-dehydro-4-deoxyglucarate dehydratase [Rhodoglobus sp.]|nr:5-dehydro-4-deoxyglucarate dehydratase [Rhodoglobus sp.]